MKHSCKIQVWLGGAFSFKGGIQAFNKFFLKALDLGCPKCDFNVFVKSDSTHDGFSVSPQFEFTFFGKIPRCTRTFLWGIGLIYFAALQRPCLIICGHINFSPLAALINRFLGIPYAVIVHGVDAWKVKEQSKLNGLIGAEIILAVSDYTREQIIRQIGNKHQGKVIVFHNTFDEERFAPRAPRQDLLERYGLRNKKIILSVGRLASTDRYKGYEIVIRAMGDLTREFPDLHYLIVGGGDDKARLENIVVQLGLTKHVTFAGFVTDDELPDHYNLCDVFIMPSKGEGFGIVFIEAMGCGKPVIAGNKDGSVDALRGGELGVLVDPDDRIEITETIGQVLRQTYPLPILYNPSLLSAKVREYFGFRIFRERLQELLKRII